MQGRNKSVRVRNPSSPQNNLKPITMQTIEINKIKTKREFIKRKADSKTTYITGGYCRFNKAYEITDWNNINKTMYLKKGTEVFIDFEF
jgi:hypothetical protein